MTIEDSCLELKRLAEIMETNDLERKEYVKKVDAWFDELFERGRERRARTAEAALHAANTELWKQIEEHKAGGSE